MNENEKYNEAHETSVKDAEKKSLDKATGDQAAKSLEDKIDEMNNKKEQKEAEHKRFEQRLKGW